MKVYTLGIDPEARSPRDLADLPLPFVLLVQDLQQGITPDWIPEALVRLRRGADLVRASRLDPASHVVVKPSETAREGRRFRWRKRYASILGMLRGVPPADFGSGTFAIRGAAVQALLSRLENHKPISKWIMDLQIHAVRERLVIDDIPCRIEKRVSRPNHAVTADDWGLSPAVNEGILDLAQRGIIRRVSVLADGQHVSHGLAELQALPRIEFSLHFNLTHGKDFNSPLRLLRAIFLGRLKPETVRTEFLRQIRRLRELGIRPSFLDGHHHCHVYPRVLPTLTPLLKEFGIVQVRIPYDPATWAPGRAVINLLALLARRHLTQVGIASQPFYYPTLIELKNPELLRSRLAERPSSEVLVHPATRDDFTEHSIDDPYRSGRVHEYTTLRGLESRTPRAPEL